MEDQVLGLGGKIVHAEKNQLDRTLAGVGVLVPGDFFPGGAAECEFLFEFARQGLLRRFAGLDFAARKLPFQRVRLTGHTLSDENAPIAFDNGGHHLKHVTIGAYGMYPDLLLDHFQNPRNVGELPPPAETFEVSNPACGDILRLSVLWENGRIAEVRYKVRGCTASIAAGSALTEWLSGKSRAEMATFTAAMIDEAVGGLPAASKHAAVLCADAVKRLR